MPEREKRVKIPRTEIDVTLSTAVLEGLNAYCRRLSPQLKGLRSGIIERFVEEGLAREKEEKRGYENEGDKVSILG